MMSIMKWVKAIIEDRRVMKVLGFRKGDFIKVR